VDDCIKQTGLRPAEYLDSIGVFDTPTYVAHGVFFSDNELEILKKKNVSVVHNPSSNCKLASGICPISHYKQMGINVALGTDGASSNNNLSMIKEMRLAAMLSTVSTMKPASITPYEILEMATINGAKALGLADKIGTLEVGKDADIVLINKNIAEMTPLNNIFSALVFSMPDRAVDSVYCQGKQLLEDGKLLTIDEEDVIKKINKQWEDILRR
ncbi:amidohydrolase family protein, partial [Bullifex sp.]|uniref:amidohydrolase family protein n=1 Tax=Bullifex sp. TaxID=2815808 RepID=UPI002A819D2F